MGRPKQLLPLRGAPLLQHAVGAAAAAGLQEILVVLGNAADEVAAALSLPSRARVVVNEAYAEGQSTSLRAGLLAAPPDARAVVVLLGDQPGVSPEAIRAVVEEYRRRPRPAVQAAYGGVPGHPVLLARETWPEIEAVRGDAGARDVLDRHPEWVAAVEIGGEAPGDVDTWEDYERMTADDGA